MFKTSNSAIEFTRASKFVVITEMNSFLFRYFSNSFLMFIKDINLKKRPRVLKPRFFTPLMTFNVTMTEKLD